MDKHAAPAPPPLALATASIHIHDSMFDSHESHGHERSASSTTLCRSPRSRPLPSPPTVANPDSSPTTPTHGRLSQSQTQTPSMRRTMSPTFSDSDSCSASSYPTTPVYSPSPPGPPLPPRGARRPVAVGKGAAGLEELAHRVSTTSLAASAAPVPVSLASSSTSSTIASMASGTSTTSTTSSSLSLSPGSPSHPFLVDQTPYISRRLSEASMRSTASASSACPSEGSVPWASGSWGARSVERFDRASVSSDRIGSLGSAADHMLAEDSASPRGLLPPIPDARYAPGRRESHGSHGTLSPASPASSATPLAPPSTPPPAALTSIISTAVGSHGHGHGHGHKKSTSGGGSWPFRHRRGSNASSSPPVHFNYVAPPVSGQALASADAILPPQPKRCFKGHSSRAGNSNTHGSTPCHFNFERGKARDSSSSSLSVRSTSSSSSSLLATPSASSPEPGASPTVPTAIDRRCLTWMREAEQHEHYFGSVKSRGGLGLSPEERGTLREPIAVVSASQSQPHEPDARDTLEVLQDEKRSCNPLKRFTSRSST